MTKVVISNPAKQYTHHLVYAFYRKRKTVRFYTQIWDKPSVLLKIMTRFVPSLKNQLLKRGSSLLNPDIVYFNNILFMLSIPLRMIKSIETRSYVYARLHDIWVSLFNIDKSLKLFVGYEKASIYSFKRAKKSRVVTILDLAQVHPSFIRELRDKFTFFKNVTGSNEFFEKIFELKNNEYQLADYVIAISDFATQTMLQNGFPKERIFTAPLGVDLSLFKSKWEIYNFKSQKKLQLVFCGTVMSRKGVQDLTSMMYDYELLPIELTIIGPLSTEEELNLDVINHPSIKHIGFLTHELLVKELQHADVFVFPSYLDSWGQVVIEAMACGLPVIVSENTGAKEAVTEDCGFIIPVNDVEALQEKVIYFLDNKEMIMPMGQAARKQAEKYSWENYYNTIDTIVEEICHREGISITDFVNS